MKSNIELNSHHTMDYSSNSNRYLRQARQMLQNAFPLISCAAIDAVLSSLEYKFTIAFHVLTTVEHQRPGIDGNGAGQFEGIDPNIKVFIKQKRAQKIVDLTDQDELLAREIENIPELNTKAGNIPTIDLAASTSSEEDANGADDKAQGTLIECLCCYGDYQRSEMKECKNGSGHLVCTGCLNNYVSEQLDGNDSITFKCIVDVECQCEYPLTLLEEDGVLAHKLKDRVNDKIFREMVKEAGIDNCW